MKFAYPTHRYEEAEPGFAEHDLDEFERVSAELAWGRSVETVRKGIGMDVELGRVVEENVQSMSCHCSSRAQECGAD